MIDAESRPDPVSQLKDERQAGRGRLKVFLGMSPGVGKTYEMLKTARRLKAEGSDVAIGVVETHGRRETEALLRGMEVLARKPLDYRRRMLLEFDIDAALTRKPALLLVDEYAHSNVPGSRHPKRWQDVEELLAAGIDVWTTLNVQHLESLVDVVWKITGIRQRETVPDLALSKADEIEVVDITPSELRRRLAEGKVYVPETAQLASDRFFRLENLTALRELALRRAAQTVDDQLVGAMKRAGVEGPWAAGERIMVLIGGDAMAPSLVRAGRRLSDMMMDAPWTVAHIEQPNRPPASSAAQARISETMKLAEQLGGSTIMLSSDDLVGCAFGYARQNNVTQIVIGKSHQNWWRTLRGQSLPHSLLDRAAGAALHIVTDTAPGKEPPAPPRVPRDFTQGWQGYLIGAAFVVAAAGLSFVLDSQFERANLGMIFLSAVLAAGVLFGLRPGLAAATAAFLIYNFFFLEPRYSFEIGSPTDLVTLFVFWAVALVTGGLAGRIRDQSRATSRRAAATFALLSASRRLSAAATRDEAAKAIAEQVSAAAAGGATVLLPAGGVLVPVASSPETEPLSASEMAAARWAWERGEAAGAGTGTLPNLTWTFYPLQGVRARAGVVGVESGHSGEDNRFVLALLDQGAVALERADLAAAAADADTLRRADQLRAALLNSISHDLRTPLATVLGAATTLLDYGTELKLEVRVDLLESIREEAERLNGYVGNLLDMTRLEGGALNPRLEWSDMRDVLNGAADRVARRLGKRRLARVLPPELPMVRIDPALLEQAIVNILENSIAYSADATPITLSAEANGANIVVAIADEGRGIAPDMLPIVFDKFRQAAGQTGHGQGYGLGLSISKGFIEAMGGTISAESPIHEGRGTQVRVTLPITMPDRPAA